MKHVRLILNCTVLFLKKCRWGDEDVKIMKWKNSENGDRKSENVRVGVGREASKRGKTERGKKDTDKKR